MRGRVALAVALSAMWLLYMGFKAVPGGPQDTPGPPPPSTHDGVSLWMFSVVMAVIVSFLLLSAWAMKRLLRNDATRFRDLDDEEKARRRAAGELLKEGGTKQAR